MNKNSKSSDLFIRILTSIIIVLNFLVAKNSNYHNDNLMIELIIVGLINFIIFKALEKIKTHFTRQYNDTDL
ncbi:hypothetical protein [Tepidibacter sp. Z1-5]|uniref:hypothetical protein n=1 Tax=Tepidibacter sp. Z1-5 TaxID=3134138 RepID=UPI0030BE4E6A